jgi:hypothetical protein
MAALEIPFRVGEQVTGEYFTDREQEVARILAAFRSPTRLLVYGERRQGKSSAIRQAQVRAEHDGIHVLWVDLSTISQFGELAQRLVSSVPFGWTWREELQLRLLRAQLRVEARTDALGRPVLALGVESADADEGKDRLRRIVGALDEIAGTREQRLVLVLDEFQEIDRVVARGSWFLRDLMQTSHHLSFVCAGSRLSLIDELIAETGPLYRFFEPLTVGAIAPDHLARWIESRMEGAGVAPPRGLGEDIIRRVGPRTQDCLQLARVVYLAAAARGQLEPGDVASALRRAVLEDRDRFETLWEGLADSHRGILRALAAGERRLGAQDVRRRYGLPSTSAISKAVKALQDRRHLSAREPIRIDDPYFREWILLQAMADGLPHTAVPPDPG